MDRFRFGRGVRALRERRGLTQTQLASRLDWSRSKVSRIERGRLAGVAFDDLERVAGELDARLGLDLAWRAAGLDRLIDERHATLVDATVRWLSGAGWEVAVEASFSEFGERGSIDVFAHHPTGNLLVVEVKATMCDVNQTLIAIDRKVRLAPRIATGREWPVGPVGAVLVVAATTTARRRIARHDVSFRASLGTSALDCRRWIRAPSGRPARGIVFLELADSRRVSGSETR